MNHHERYLNGYGAGIADSVETLRGMADSAEKGGQHETARIIREFSKSWGKLVPELVDMQRVRMERFEQVWN